MDLTNRVNTWAEPAVDRSAQTIPIELIHNACLGELDRLLRTPLTRRIDRVAYRDTLIVLLLSAAPVRLRNLAMIEIGVHLTLDEDACDAAVHRGRDQEPAAADPSPAAARAALSAALPRSTFARASDRPTAAITSGSASRAAP